MSKIKDLLQKQVKGENLLLIILGVVAAILGVLILANVLSVKGGMGILSMYPNAFAWVLISVGVFGILLGFYKISRGKL